MDQAAPPVGAVPASPSVRPADRGRLPSGRNLVVLLAVVALLVAGTAGALLRGRDGSTTFAATDQVPLSFSYPREWRQHVHPGQFAMLSPHDLTNFVSDLEDPWAAVRPLLADDRETVVGVFLPFRARTLDVDSKPNVEAALEGLLPEVPGKRTLSFLDHRPDKVDGHAADRVSGRMDDPGDQDTSLAFVDYVIQIKSGVAVHLLLFGPDERALGSADFNRLAKSVRLDAARVA